MRFSLFDTAVKDRGHPHTISLKLRDLNQALQFDGPFSVH